MPIITLEYHDVVADGASDATGYPGSAANSYKLELSRFEAHLDALARSRVSVGTTVDLLTEITSRERSALLTFDDGGLSALSAIAPSLERRGWVGHFFIATDYIGCAGFVDAAQLRELVSRGHVVGSHSRTHPLRMASLTRDQLREEWKSSVGRLADILGAAPTVASVPGGGLSRPVIDTAREAGIRILFTSEPTTKVIDYDGCALYGRFTLRRNDGAAVVTSLIGSSTTARASQWLSWNSKKLVKRIGGSLYLRVREAMFRS